VDRTFNELDAMTALVRCFYDKISVLPLPKIHGNLKLWFFIGNNISY